MDHLKDKGYITNVYPSITAGAKPIVQKYFGLSSMLKIMAKRSFILTWNILFEISEGCKML